MIGFRCPTYVTDINLTSYHLYFLTESQVAVRHVLEFKVEDAVFSVNYNPEFFIILP